MEEVEIHIASSAGVCFGVERALNLSEKALTENVGPISSVGPLIHNPQAVKALSDRGLSVINSLEQASGTVIFRSHGVTVDVQRMAAEKNLKVIDATCPLVKVPQNFARKLSQNGYFVIIVGDKDHPEVQGVKSYVENGEVAVVADASEVMGLPKREKVGVISQTTLKKKIFLEVVEKCQGQYREVKVHNTICGATKDRQEAALELAQKVDCVVVIGGKNSSNTQKLYDICRENSKRAYLIEEEAELQAQWFENVKKIGITAGASTPHDLIRKVQESISKMVTL